MKDHDTPQLQKKVSGGQDGQLLLTPVFPKSYPLAATCITLRRLQQRQRVTAADADLQGPARPYAPQLQPQIFYFWSNLRYAVCARRSRAA
jgi:hypothetical protein